jgi:hypothetical protein
MEDDRLDPALFGEPHFMRRDAERPVPAPVELIL